MTKHHKKHALSERSLLANKDFDKANRLASKVYSIFRTLLPYRERKSYERLCKTMLQVIHRETAGSLGERRLRQGNLGYFLGYRLHPYTLLDTLFLRFDDVRLSFEDGAFIVHLPIVRPTDLKVPDHATQVLFKICFIEIDEDSGKIDSHTSPSLRIPLSDTGSTLSIPKKFRLALPQAEGKIILVVFTMQTILKDGGGLEYLSLNRKYYAGEILAAGYVRDGKWISFEKATPVSKAKEKNETENGSGEWEDA